MAGLLAGGFGCPVAWSQAPPAAAGTPGPQGQLVEAFQKGPITLTAKVTRALASGESASLPLFQVPVLAYQDQLELAFAGEAFDRRVTDAEWSVVVVFLPRTVAPTDQGVVDFRLKRKDGQMRVPMIRVPYDSVPMIFLVPDKNARKKVLKDLNDHLAQFRTLCSKISDISTQRAAADKFLEDLDGIDKNLSESQYDNALQSFLHAYGDPVSAGLQSLVQNAGSSNLEKCQFITQQFRDASVLVPASATSAPVTAQVTLGAGGGRPTSAYISILFDVAAIINNLWPGHQFQYLPAVARDFRGDDAELYYSDWIHTTGDVRGALMCCPGKWEDQAPPAFQVGLGEGESLLHKQALLRVRPRDPERTPFTLYGHDWKLLLTGPAGEVLPPVPLTPSPNRQSLVASTGPVLEALRKLGAPRVKARVVGRWGFTSLALDPVELSAGLDPAWKPSAGEAAAFQAGRPCSFKLPSAWAANVGQVAFLRAGRTGAPLAAQLKPLPDGGVQALLQPAPADAGPGSLEIRAVGAARAGLHIPLTLLPAQPEVAGLDARVGESTIRLKGKFLEGIQAVEVGGRRFRPMPRKDGGEIGSLIFQALDGKPLQGPSGRKCSVSLVLPGGKPSPLAPVLLLPARPQVGEVQIIPVAARTTGLNLRAGVPIASTNEPVQVGLLTAKGYRFPADGAFRAALRNAEDPQETRSIPASKMRVMGHDQKAAFTFTPTDLLGGMAAGRLEVQVQDDKAGASDWVPLPATFLDLPAIGSVQGTVTGFRLTGASLDPIQAVAATPSGPWEQAAIAIEDGREVADFTTRLSGNTCYLKLFGWDDLPVALSFPPIPAADPVKPAPTPAAPKPAAPAQAAPTPAAPKPAVSVPAAPTPAASAPDAEKAPAPAAPAGGVKTAPGNNSL